ncbi:putative DNA lyase apn2 protein [Thozetella sp. PMI_491]|nr:putative DNA lyase apn2 protein [Thozetella sp. PMI_491]
MGLRITTWNVNGIRNPFGYQPWRENRTFQAMFDTLEADIVVMQETKIQRKDLQDDMVLVPGWDVFFSLPKHKKGYSGVAIYTRNSKCCPIRAEEGITGALCPPGSTLKFRELPESQQIGGYPRPSQLSMDDAVIDSEGRCVLLEFPAFVLIGVYSPATRDESRTEFRLAFTDALDARIRNLVAMGKQVFLCGDLNIIRGELDAAGLAERLRKEGMAYEEFISMPSRRFFNQFVFGGEVLGERDEGREHPVMWDLCRELHPTRLGMYTCWETKKNARPGNFGSRIDYVLCTSGIKDWFVDANIQEGLFGSDHCPVYAILADTVTRDGKEISLADVMNPDDMFRDGKRLREWSTKDILPTSAKLIPEFDRRRNIRDMFAKKPSATQDPPTKLAGLAMAPSSSASTPLNTTLDHADDTAHPQLLDSPQYITSPDLRTTDMRAQTTTIPKRTFEPPISTVRPQKKAKASSSKDPSGKGPGLSQKSLKGFFKPKNATLPANPEDGAAAQTDGPGDWASSPASSLSPAKPRAGEVRSTDQAPTSQTSTTGESEDSFDPSNLQSDRVIDPIVAKESWSKLLGKRVVPKCEHGEDCQTLVTKKAGMNRGRSFFMCSRPLGPSGDKEQGTEFRCRTFIWSSDWSGRR